MDRVEMAVVISEEGDEVRKFQGQGLDVTLHRKRMNEITAEVNMDKLEILRKAYMRILEKDEWKNRFRVLSNLLMNLYDASKPEIFERGWHHDKFAPISYLNGLFNNQIDDEKLERAKARMAEKLDQSVTSTDKACDDYDRISFNDKTNLLMKHFIDMAVQGYGWTTA